MKGFIILAVTSFLVGLQASSISRVQTELDSDESKTVETQWMLEELYGTFPHGALDEVQNIHANFEALMGCRGNTCEWCLFSACFQISYLQSSNEFKFCAAYKGNNIICQSVPGRDFKYCKTIKVSILNVELCIEVTNVNISGGKACMDVKLSVSGISKTFPNICLGTSNHFNLA